MPNAVSALQRAEGVAIRAGQEAASYECEDMRALLLAEASKTNRQSARVMAEQFDLLEGYTASSLDATTEWAFERAMNRLALLID